MAASTSAHGWTDEVEGGTAGGASVSPANPTSADVYIPYRPSVDPASSHAPTTDLADGQPADEDEDDEDDEDDIQPIDAPAPLAVHGTRPEARAQAQHAGTPSESGSNSESDEEAFDPQLYPSITTGSSRHVPPRAFSDAESEASSESGESGSEYVAEEQAPAEAPQGVYTYVTKTGRIKIKNKPPTRISARIRVSPGEPTDIVPLAVRSKAAVPGGSSRSNFQASHLDKTSAASSPSRTRSSQSPSASSAAQPTASTSTAPLPSGKPRKGGRKPKAALMATDGPAPSGIQGWDGPEAPAAAPPKTGIKKVTLSLKSIAPAPGAAADKDKGGPAGASTSADSGKQVKRLPRKRRFKAGALSAEIITAEMDEESEVEAATVNDSEAGEGGATTTDGTAKAAKKGAAKEKKDKSDKSDKADKADKGERPRKKRKGSESEPSSRRLSIGKTPKGTRPPPLNGLDKKEPSVPRPDRGLISPVVTGFPVHTADTDTLDSLRTAWKIKEQQRQLINARKNGETTPAVSPGMGPPVSGNPHGQPAPVSADGRQALPPVSANGSVGQRRGEVAREKVNNLRLNTAGGDSAQQSTLAMRSAPISQMPDGSQASGLNGFLPGEQYEGDMSTGAGFEPHTVPPLQTQPRPVDGGNGQGYANGHGHAGSSTHGFRPDSRNGAMTAYPSLGTQQQYQQQQAMLPPTSTAPSSQMSVHNGRRASAHSLSTSSSGHMRPPSMHRGDKGGAGPLLTHAPFNAAGMSMVNKDNVMQPLQVQPIRPPSMSYAPGDPTPMQAHFGPGRSPPSSTIRREFGPAGRDWYPPQTGGLYAPQAGPSQHRMSNGDIAGLPGGYRHHPAAGVPDAHRAAFMEPFNLFYDALMDSNQLRGELQAKVAKATELIAAQENELARFKAMREEYEASLADMAARDAEIEALKRKVAALEKGTVDDASSASSDSEADAEGDADVNMA